MPTRSQILLQALGNTAVNKIPCHYGAHIPIKEYRHYIKYIVCSLVISVMDKNKVGKMG